MDLKLQSVIKFKPVEIEGISFDESQIGSGDDYRPNQRFNRPSYQRNEYRSNSYRGDDSNATSSFRKFSNNRFSNDNPRYGGNFSKNRFNKDADTDRDDPFDRS